MRNGFPGMSEQFWIELLKSGPIGFATLVGAVITLVSSCAAVIQNLMIKRQQNRVEENTNGKLTRILMAYENERIKREQAEQERAALCAILSARFNKPVTSLRDIARAEDFGEKPGNGSVHPQRRSTDKDPT